MRFVLRKRLLFSCLYLGALLLVAGTLFYVLQGFQGTVFLQRGVAESLAFRPSTGSASLGTSQRNVPPDLLLLDNPRVVSVLRKNQTYDAMVLPFALRLDDAEILAERPPRQWLQIESPDASRRMEVESGATIPLAEGTLKIDRLGPWAGLVRGAQGRAMASVSIDQDAEHAPRFLDDGLWKILTPALAIGFFWHADEAALKASKVPALDDLQAARWGVRDGNADQWLSNFAPGAGLRLRDGTQVSLVEDRRGSGEIEIHVATPSGEERIQVTANTGTPDAPYLLEDPAATGLAVELHAWREDQIICRILRPDTTEERALAPGDALSLPENGTRLQVLQVMANAIPVPAGEVHAMYGVLDGQPVTVREGLTETHGAIRLQYEREHQPPEARYHISALGPSGETRETVVLESGDTARVGAWVLALAEENPFAPAGIAVDVVRRPGGFAQYLGLGLFVAGCFGLLLVRFGLTTPD